MSKKWLRLFFEVRVMFAENHKLPARPAKPVDTNAIRGLRPSDTSRETRFFDSLKTPPAAPVVFYFPLYSVLLIDRPARRNPP
jgi:hypothetical protein